MRIIAGRFGGRKLVAFNASHIRPTTDRVKESLFNIIQGEIPDSCVLDLFAGTGALGFESLSRGAKSVTAVESHKKSQSILKANAKSLGLDDKEYTLVPKDVFQFLEKNKEAEDFQVVLVDPPFTKAIAHEVMQALEKCNFVKKGALVAIESAKHERIDDEYGEIHLLDRRDFGDKSLSLFRKREF